MFKKIVIFLTIFLTFSSAKPLLAHQPVIVGNETIYIQDPEISRAFYDELSGIPQRYFIESNKEFELYLNLLVPLKINPNGRYSAKVYDLNNNLQLLATVDGPSVPWSVYYETFAKDYYYKGPEYDKIMPAGKYAIDIYSGDNQGKYVLALGKIENFSVKNSLNIVSLLRDLKVNFFETSPFTLTITIFGIVYLATIFIAALLFFIIYKIIVHQPQKTSLKKKLIKSSLFVVLIMLGLYTWNPIVFFIADILFIDTSLDLFSQRMIKSYS